MNQQERFCATCGKPVQHGYRFYCNTCHNRMWRANHPNYMKEWAQTHRQNLKVAQHKYKFTHRQESNKRTREWEKKNPEKAAIRKIKGSRVDKTNLRYDVLSHYSNGSMTCACCGESIQRFLTIDDMDDFHNTYKKAIGSGIRFYRWLRKNNYPYGYQVMCFNCNSGRDLNGGICPHKEAKNATST